VRATESASKDLDDSHAAATTTTAACVGACGLSILTVITGCVATGGSTRATGAAITTT
jgi:hypothetical protein